LQYFTRFFCLIGFCLFVTLAMGVSNTTKAQEQGTTSETQQGKRFNIAILDMKGVLQKSTAVKSIHAQINNYRTGFHSEIQNEENQLRKARQELSRQRNILSPESYAEATKEFESRVAEVQRMVQIRRQELDQSRKKAMSEVQSALNGIIGEIANERNLALILRREQTVLSIRSIEITEEVIKRLNETLPDITVPQPGN